MEFKAEEVNTCSGRPLQNIVKRADYQMLSQLSSRLDRFFRLDYFTGDPELQRRAKLLIGFGVLGSIFGLIYAAFYFVIGHLSGAIIVMSCSLAVALTPFILRWKRSLPFAAESFSIILVLGFTALCLVEGGMFGHALAWLVSVPLCQLILMGTQSAVRWCIYTLLMASVVVVLNFNGYATVPSYDPKWHGLVSAAGYLGLSVFMFILGLIFERGRRKAHEKMQMALVELSRSNEKLVSLNRDKSEFLSIAAHDLNNPLTNIMVRSELMAMEGETPADIQKHAAQILYTSGRMRDLIQNLLDLNAIEEGRMNLSLESCDLSALLRQVALNFEPISHRKNIKIIHEGEDGEVVVKADAHALTQIMENLISNAVKYSAKDTKVFLRVVRSELLSSFSVRDEGPGLSEADQKNLYGKFVRLSPKPTGGEGSNGLGLSIVKKMVEAMKGTIECRSELGKGTTFIVSLPSAPCRTKSIQKTVAAGVV